MVLGLLPKKETGRKSMKKMKGKNGRYGKRRSIAVSAVCFDYSLYSYIF
jgi:hypothetical protein